MEPITLITAALIAGATEMSKGALGEAGKQTYTSLKNRITNLFAGNTHAVQVLEEHEQDPDTYEKPLKKVLEQSQVDKDDEVLRKSQELMSILDKEGSAQGKYHVQVTGGQGVQVGEGNQQTNYFGSGDATKP